jgi:hypothetical protein
MAASYAIFKFVSEVLMSNVSIRCSDNLKCQFLVSIILFRECGTVDISQSYRPHGLLK